MDNFLDLILSIPVIGPHVPLITFIIATASGLAAFLPEGKEGGAWAKIRKFLIELPALNVKNAKK